MDGRNALVGVLGIFFGGLVFAAPWDFLREPIQIISLIEPVTAWLLVIVTGIVAFIAYKAYARSTSQKLKWVLVGFALFFAKAVLLVIDLYFSPGNFMNPAIQSFFDVLVVGSLFVALFRTQ